jgi:hypothetical protein
MHHHSKYETQPLQEALIDAYKQSYLFGGPREKHSRDNLKVAVTSTSTAGNVIVLANYNRPCREKCKSLSCSPTTTDRRNLNVSKVSYHFQRPEKLSAELKTWEA